MGAETTMWVNICITMSSVIEMAPRSRFG